MSEPNAISAVAAPSAAEIDDGTRPDIDRCLRLFRSSVGVAIVSAQSADRGALVLAVAG
jgi:hypothetical protein